MRQERPAPQDPGVSGPGDVTHSEIILPRSGENKEQTEERRRLLKLLSVFRTQAPDYIPQTHGKTMPRENFIHGLQTLIAQEPAEVGKFVLYRWFSFWSNNADQEVWHSMIDKLGIPVDSRKVLDEAISKKLSNRETLEWVSKNYPRLDFGSVPLEQ